MIAEWIPAVPAFLAAAALLILPGLAVGAALGVRGLWFWAAAGPISMSVIALASLVGLPWGPFALVSVAVVAALLIGVVVRLIFKQQAMRDAGGATPQIDEPRTRWLTGHGIATALALAVAGAITVWRITQAIGDPGNISQTFDNIFHLNAVRFVLDQQDASPLTIGLMNSPMGNLGFYPSGWHALVSLVVSVSGASIPVATNATIAAVAAVIWVPGAVLLARTLLGRSLAVTLAAAVLATGFAAFPILLIFYGVVYPMFLGFAQVPVALSVVLGIAGLEREPTTFKLPTRWLFLLGLIPGLAVTHPGAMMALLACSVPVVLTWGFFALRGRTLGSQSTTGVWLVLGAYLAGGLALFFIVRPPRAQAGWPSTMSVPEAALRFLTSQLTLGAIPYVLGVLVLVGVAVAIVRRDRASIMMLGMYAMAAILFIVVAGVGHWGLRFWITGIWYQNIPRIEAITVFATLPLAVLGASFLMEQIVKFARDRGALAASLTTALALAMLVGVQTSESLRSIIERSWNSYQYTDDSALLSTDELALLEDLPDEVPQDATIAGNGWTGTGLAYAFSGRWVTMPHVMIDFTEEALLINEELRDAKPGSAVCNAIASENVEYVLDFGEREVHGGDHELPGLEDLAQSGAVELVRSVGDASLYRVIGCG